MEADKEEEEKEDREDSEEDSAEHEEEDEEDDCLTIEERNELERLLLKRDQKDPKKLEKHYQQLNNKLKDLYDQYGDWEYNNRKDSPRSRGGYLIALADEIDDIKSEMNYIRSRMSQSS